MRTMGFTLLVVLTTTLAHAQGTGAPAAADEPTQPVRTERIMPSDPPVRRQLHHKSRGASSNTVGRYFVQISAQRTEDALYASIEKLQSKFPQIIGDRPWVMQQLNLGGKGGTWYRGGF